MKYTRLFDIFVVVAIILNTVEKIVSVFAQTKFATIPEGNPIISPLFQKVGIVEGHIIVFIIATVAVIILRIAAVNFAPKITNTKQRQIVMNFLFIALIVTTVGFLFVLINNISVLSLYL